MAPCPCASKVSRLNYYVKTRWYFAVYLIPSRACQLVWVYSTPTDETSRDFRDTTRRRGATSCRVSWSLVGWRGIISSHVASLFSSFLDAERLGRDTTPRDWLWLKPKVKMFCNQISRETSQSLPRSLWVVLSLHSVCTRSTMLSLPFGKRKKVDWTWRSLSITYSADTDELGMRLKLGLKWILSCYC